MLTVAYDGTNYCGFQVQPNYPTIEGELNKHLSALLKTDIQVIGASRTDAGVHALCNVAVEPFTAMDELNDFRDRVMTHQVTFRQWLTDLHGCKCRYYLGRRDCMPMVSMFFGSVKRKIRHRLHKK